MRDFSPALGDRNALTRDQLEILDTKVLPTARRWLREVPNLAHHAVNTLQHWQEPLVDDRGRAYQPEGTSK
jgi:hypothetical protein